MQRGGSSPWARSSGLWPTSSNLGTTSLSWVFFTRSLILVRYLIRQLSPESGTFTSVSATANWLADCSAILLWMDGWMCVCAGNFACRAGQQGHARTHIGDCMSLLLFFLSRLPACFTLPVSLSAMNPSIYLASQPAGPAARWRMSGISQASEDVLHGAFIA